MLRFAIFTLLVGGFIFSARCPASTELTLLRSGVGVVGSPVQISGFLDTNGNGRGELLVSGTGARSISFVEDDASPRGYHEIARLDSPDTYGFRNALLIKIPGAAPALLLQWGNVLELRDAATLQVKASRHGFYGKPLLGDVDGDGQPEIIILAASASVELLDPATLELRASGPLVVQGIAVADIVGDVRAEIVSDEGRAYTVTRDGSTLSFAEVWNAGITGSWNPSAIKIDGYDAIVLHQRYSAKIARFHPAQPLQTIAFDDYAFESLFADVNGDGRVDILMMESSKIRAIDIDSGAILWERDTVYESPYLGHIYKPATTDLDNDGEVEVAWNNGSGLLVASPPFVDAPRWQSDFSEASVQDWTLVKRADGSPSIAYLTSQSRTYHLSSLGFLNGMTFADEGGSSLTWIPDYTGIDQDDMWPSAVTSLPMDGHTDTVVVAGAERPHNGVEPVARWFWTFDGTGSLLSSRKFASTTIPARVVAAQVLDRPERQIVVAGPLATFGSVQNMRVEVVDYASGALLWQSALLPSYDGAPVAQLAVTDLDADGRLDVVVAYGDKVAVLTPAAGPGVVVGHDADTFSLLDRGEGAHVRLATLRNTLRDAEAAMYDGMAAEPDKTFVLPGTALAIALFAQAPDDELMFATSSFGPLTVRRYADGEVVATSDRIGAFTSITAMDLDGDHQVEIVGSGGGFLVARLGNDYIFRSDFE